MGINEFISFFGQYKYFAIVPLAIFEGPIVSIISGFLISIGVLGFMWVFIVVWLGDLISDSFFYYLGRGGKKFIRQWNFFKISDEKIIDIEDQYEKSPWKTMIVAKISYGLGIVFMVASGVSRMSFKKFLYFAGILNAIRSLLLISTGYYFGKLALRLGPTYIAYYTLSILIIVPCLYLLIKKFKK